MSKQEISVQLQNNTSGDIQVSIFGNPANLADNINATREYRYDVTSLVFTTENEVSVQYRQNGAMSFATFTAPLLKKTIQGVVDALNGLGIGSFFYFTSGGNTYISNYDDDYEFGILDIYDTAATTLDLYWYNQTNDSSSGAMLIDVNAVNQVNSPNGLNQSGLLNVNVGDNIAVNVSVSLTETLLQFLVLRQTLGTSPTTQILYNTTLPAGGSDAYSFTIAAGFSYQVFLGLP